MMPNPGGSAPLTILQQHTSLGAAQDLDFSLSLLRRAAAGELGPMLRLYRPEPSVSFGQRDAKLPGYPLAASAARANGFEPLIRRAGGRAVAYHPGSLVIDHIEPRADAIAGAKDRFAQFGELIATALRSLGVLAYVGQIPGEYCPGEFSVHGVDPLDATHRIKLVGTAQRVISGGWLFSSSIIVQDSAPIRQVLLESYAALGLDWDPATAGAVCDLAPHVGVEDVSRALLAQYAGTRPLLHQGFESLLGP